MYRGVGGQVLYLPKDSRWAADLTVDALEQRGYKGWFDKRDYRTVTALGALHYRLPYDITVTARAGRFLARTKACASSSSAASVGCRDRRLVHQDQRQGHHQSGHAYRSVQRQGRFPVGPAEHHAAVGYPGHCRFRMLALDARRRPDGASPGDLYELMEDAAPRPDDLRRPGAILPNARTS
jgi:hypothetical protein